MSRACNFSPCIESSFRKMLRLTDWFWWNSENYHRVELGMQSQQLWVSMEGHIWKFSQEDLELIDLPCQGDGKQKKCFKGKKMQWADWKWLKGDSISFRRIKPLRKRIWSRMKNPNNWTTAWHASSAISWTLRAEYSRAACSWILGPLLGLDHVGLPIGQTFFSRSCR